MPPEAAILEELRRMPTDQLEQTALFIDKLVTERHERRNAMLDSTAGSLAGEEGKALEEALKDCEHIDEDTW
ncbi:hypothetical protein [Roseimicrobium sp. ORNL1]|uniref:hypothetical protein n=1 Tax=Roseimicrobium sp. ORNL1 TaxID=2711231 RepID=UPI0013E185E2|nr:hypothetical protein [Roseimicrobium sp. ORNL1]QIF05942.1 hypothetical protein G5S37_32125 [Roseimicrobium sp. ORNL1]